MISPFKEVPVQVEAAQQWRNGVGRAHSSRDGSAISSIPLPADAALMTGGLEWFRESFASEALRGKGLLFIRLWPGRLMELRMHKGILYLTVARQCARRHCCGVSPARLRNTRIK